jgi:hypothetical protein
VSSHLPFYAPADLSDLDDEDAEQHAEIVQAVAGHLLSSKIDADSASLVTALLEFESESVALFSGSKVAQGTLSCDVVASIKSLGESELALLLLCSMKLPLSYSDSLQGVEASVRLCAAQSMHRGADSQKWLAKLAQSANSVTADLDNVIPAMMACTPRIKESAGKTSHLSTV